MTETRILHVLQTPRAEGTPNLVLDWLAAGRGKLWQAVLVLNRTPAELNGQLRAGADTYEEHELLVRRWRKYPDMATVAYRAVRKYRPDVVVCWTTGFGNWVSAGAFAAGCRRILVHAGNPPVRSGHGDWVSRYGVWPLVAVRAKIVCCSQYVRDAYLAIPLVGGGSFSAVLNCTRAPEVARRAAAARAASGPRPPTAVMVATLESHKDHRTLLDAVPRVAAAVPGFKLRLVGGGRLRDAIAARIAELGLTRTVELLGSRSDVPELLGTSDLFVFSTTLREGLGSVLLEALAAGLPVVASDVPACRELLKGGRFGTLVPPADPVALGDAIVAHLSGTAASAAGGSDYAGSLTADRMIDAYLKLVRL